MEGTVKHVEGKELEQNSQDYKGQTLIKTQKSPFSVPFSHTGGIGGLGPHFHDLRHMKVGYGLYHAWPRGIGINGKY